MIQGVALLLVAGLGVPASSNEVPKSCRTHTIYTRVGNCVGFARIPDLETCAQLCNENATPDESACPVPEGGCRYAIFNPQGEWCNLAGEDCILRYGGPTVMADTRAGPGGEEVGESCDKISCIEKAVECTGDCCFGRCLDRKSCLKCFGGFYKECKGCIRTGLIPESVSQHSDFLRADGVVASADRAVDGEWGTKSHTNCAWSTDIWYKMKFSESYCFDEVVIIQSLLNNNAYRWQDTQILVVNSETGEETVCGVLRVTDVYQSEYRIPCDACGDTIKLQVNHPKGGKYRYKGCMHMREILVFRKADVIDGGWTEFEDWSECSAKCGGGTQTRSRTCTNPAPANGGANCQGDAVEQQACNTETCQVFPESVAQSSDYTREDGVVSVADRAVDGKYSTKAHTICSWSTDIWYEMTFSESYCFDEVVILQSHLNDYAYRWQDTQIFVFDSNTGAEVLCGVVKVTDKTAETYQIPCDACGDRIKLQVNHPKGGEYEEKGCLHMREIKAFRQKY